MIVVDTNVIACLLTPGEATEDVQRVVLHDPDWAAPFLWRSEFRNVLFGWLRRGDVDLAGAHATMEAADNLIRGREFLPSSTRVLELCLQAPISAYDAEFVALAEELDVRLVSADRRLVARFPGRAVLAADV